MKRNKLTLIISFVLSLLLITIGLSFAYFTSNITGTENTTTIQASGGVMNIHYDGGENITTPNIFPSNDAFATKNFTLTGKSTTNDNMNYHIILVIEENTFTNNALQYKLTSTNTDGNGTVAPSIIQSGIANGTHEIYLGDGIFVSPANNKEHSYILELYFPDTIEDQNDDMDKTFKAYVSIREGQYNFPGYNPDKGVNHPVLFTGMTPVKWDGTTEIETTEDDSDWYNYDEKRWANAKSKDGSYWVWIPRYAYKIESCYHTSGEDCLTLTGKEAGDIDVKFLKGRTNITDDNTTIESAGYIAHEKDTSMHHFLHPAFQFNGEELGFWMAKFEPTAAEGLESGTTSESCNIADNTSEKTVKILPGEPSWRCINISNAFNASLAMKIKTATYGWFSEEIDTHLITNHEWGAVAYLSKSKYGAEDEEVWNNAFLNFETGCSGLNSDSYNLDYCIEYNTENGQKASTTHNIYGVYDMSGGAWDRVMGNYNNITANSGFEDLVNIDIRYISKYFTHYTKLLENIGMDYDTKVYGDAVFETSHNAHRKKNVSWEGEANGSWYSDYSKIQYNNAPWFVRGTYRISKSPGGIFGFGESGAGAGFHTSFRPVLMPLKQASS